MRRLKVTMLVVLLSAGMLAVIAAATLSWLMKSESGSHWLLQQGLDLSPVTIEAHSVSGTLADGLYLERLNIFFTSAEVRATQIRLSWSPLRLFTGVIDIDGIELGELSVDVIEVKGAEQAVAATSDSSGDDQLFWLDFPLQVNIASGKIGKLRIDELAFEDLGVTGSIGHDQLAIESLQASTAGIQVQLSGKLNGPAPGKLEATGSWMMAEHNLEGSGSFSGDIKKLAFEHVVHVPEVVNFNGTIFDLFEQPSLAGVADWKSVRLPGDQQLSSNDGKITVGSDFRSVRLEGDNALQYEDWPTAPMQLQAEIDLQGITINRYNIKTLEGELGGQGRIEYSDALNGRIQIDAQQLDTAMLSDRLTDEALPGSIDFAAILSIESGDSFVIDVSRADVLLSDRRFSGAGHARWQDEKLASLDAAINAGSNQLTARIKQDTELAGQIDIDAPDLEKLWPGLLGRLGALITLGGSPQQPKVSMKAEATAVSLGSQSLQTLYFTADIQGENSLAAKLVATGLVSDKRQLGQLDIALDGSLNKFRSMAKLSGGMVAAALHSTGSWHDGQLVQRFGHGRFQPDGFESWQLMQQPELRMTMDSGEVSAHCWKQAQASICIDASNWGPGTLSSRIDIDSFALKTLQPILADGYSIDGTVDADIRLQRNSKGQQGQLQWRQSQTVLAYTDGIDTFSSVLDDVRIDLVSNEQQTELEAKLAGEAGLDVTASATVNGPLLAESPLQATAKGRLPSIEILRSLARRVVHPGKLQGELKIDLAASGTLGDPVFTGGAYLNDGLLELLGYGVTLSNINVTAESRGGDKLLVNGELTSGEGSARIEGEVRATEQPGLVADIRIQGQDMTSLRTPDLSVDTSPNLALHIAKDVFDISGSIFIPRASARIRSLPKNAVPRSDDVIVHTEKRADEKKGEMIVTGNVEVVLGDDVRFNGFGLNSRLDGGLRLIQSRGGYLLSSGTVRVRDGFLTGYGKELRVDRGELTFTGPLDDPLINIQVSRESIFESRQYIIGLRLTGSAQNVKTEPFSRPSMSERDVLSFLLLDRPANDENDASGAALALGLQQLVPGEEGILGLDEVSFETNDANKAAMVAGKRINDELYVRYVFGAQGQPGAFRIRYSLGGGFSLESSTGARQSLDLIYILER
jgi:translocation and assembly module TamB